MLALVPALGCRPGGVSMSQETGSSAGGATDTDALDTGGSGTPGWEVITREGDRLMDGAEEFRFVSFNIPNLHMLEDPEWHIPDPWEQGDAMATVAQMGGRVARIYTLSVGESYNEVPRHLTRPGEFSEELFVALDHAIAQAEAHQIRLIIPFVDQWQWWGGITEYAAFRGLEAEDFWTDYQLKEDYKETVRFVLERVNTVSGIPYAEDPTILAWETGNELDSPSEWTAEMVRFIRSLAPTQLIADGHYGIDEASLDNPDVDIVSNHYYWPDGYGEDYAAAASADRALAQGKRPFIIGEFGLIGTDRYEALMDTVIDEGITGAMIWSLRYHAVDGGFYWHTEVDDGDWLVRSYHWPGFDSGEAYDERAVLALMRESAYRIQGKEPPQLKPPEPPSIQFYDASGLTWRGSAGASSYSLERALDEEGEWQEVASDLDDSISENMALYLDDSYPDGVDLYYRMQAWHDGISSEISETFGPIRWPRQKIDELDDLSQLSHHDEDLKIDDSNPDYFGGDPGRLCRTAAGEQQAVWTVDGTLTEVEATGFFWPHEDRPSLRFETSVDGVSFEEVPAGQTERGGDWSEVLFTVTELPEGSTMLRLSFEDGGSEVWNPQLSRMVLRYQ